MPTRLRNQCQILVQPRQVFHVKHSARFDSLGCTIGGCVSRETHHDFAYGVDFAKWRSVPRGTLLLDSSHNEIIEINYHLLLEIWYKYGSLFHYLLLALSTYHFTDVHQSTRLLYVTGGLELVGTISGWSGWLGGGAGRCLLGGLGLRWEPGRLRLGGGWCRSALRLGGSRCRLGGSLGVPLRLRLGRRLH